MPIEKPLIALIEIKDLTTRYWHDVDYNWGSGAAEFFTEDGVFEVDGRRFVGRDEIRKFYSWRQGRGARVARHIVDNMVVDLDGDRRAESRWVMSLYANDGVPPLPSEPAIMMADIMDRCVRDSDGRWRYEYRRITPLFVGRVPATVPPDTNGTTN